MLRWLGQAVAAMGGGERLTLPVIALIIGRLREINQRFARLVARLAAGTYQPRRCHGRKAAARNPGRANPLLQKFGWLLPLVPDAVGHRSQLENLLRDPAMAALIAAAPAPMARVLRPLCWMLRVTPPPILARPSSEAATAPAAASAPPPSDSRPAPPPPPAPPVRSAWAAAPALPEARGSPVAT